MIVVAGEALVDLVVDGEATTEVVGGAALNVAVGLARLDAPTVLVTQVGSDDRGGRILDYLTRNGVEALAEPTGSGRTATATALLDPVGSASSAFDIDWSLPPMQLPPCDALHVGALGTLLEPGRTSVWDLVDQAFARGVAVSYDVNVRDSFVADRSQVWRDVEALAERCRVVKLSDQDVEVLLPGADPDDIARSLLTAERTELVVVTRGGEGATGYTGSGQVSVSAPPVDVVDTVGAGDAFMAGLLTVLLESSAFDPSGAGMPGAGSGLRRLLRASVEVASLTCARRGAQPPTRLELPPDWPDWPDPPA